MKNNSIIKAAMFCSMAAFIFFSCKHEPPAPPVINCNIKDSIKFTEDIIPIFDTYCNFPSNGMNCHAGPNPDGHLNLEAAVAYQNLYAEGQINRSVPTASVLYISMNSTNPSMPPLPVGRLDSCTIQSVVKWIAQGGKNN